MLNYIRQLNKFEELCTGVLPPKAQIIYYKLFKWSNRFGLGEPFHLSNKLLMSECEIVNEKTFIQNRNLLIQTGFIDFSAGKKGSPSTYVLLDLTKYTDNTPVNNNKNTGNTPVNNTENTVIYTDDTTVNNNKNTGNTPVNNTENTVIYTDDTTVNNEFLPIPKIKKETGEDLSNLQSSSLKEAVDIFQNTFRPLKNVYEAEQIKSMVEDYGIERFREAVQVTERNRAKVPLPYLESVLRNNKASPRGKPAGNLKNNAKAGMQRALEILEGDED